MNWNYLWESDLYFWGVELLSRREKCFLGERIWFLRVKNDFWEMDLACGIRECFFWDLDLLFMK